MQSARKLDQFYTQPGVAKQCIEFLKQCAATKNRFFLEPSAGTGAFLKLLPPKNRMGLDLDPKFGGIQQCDFFEFSPAALPAGKKVIVIGNPPFGKNSSLALRCVNKAAEFAEIVAFILPCTFKKASALRKLNPNLHLLGELKLGQNAFEFEGAAYDVPCVFQVWRRKSARRPVADSPLVHPDFQFCGPEEASFAIRRVGGLLLVKPLENAELARKNAGWLELAFLGSSA